MHQPNPKWEKIRRDGSLAWKLEEQAKQTGKDICSLCKSRLVSRSCHDGEGGLIKCCAPCGTESDLADKQESNENC